MKDLFCAKGSWLKGNLHMHTTVSDGRRTPEEALEFYRNAGYDFVALTDHWRQGKTGVRGGLLVLNGCEWDVGDVPHGNIYHILGIGMEREVPGTRADLRTPQEVIDAIRAAGGAAVLAHPAWSLTDPREAMKLTGIVGAEIYNSVSTVPWNGDRADSSLYFDLWAANGKIVRCLAGDDSHFYTGEQTRSCIMLRAEECSPEAILRALERGDFYASQGPRFTDLRVGGGKVEVGFTGADTAVFYSNTVWCGDRVARGCRGAAAYTIKETDRFVRVELWDEAGNRAWSSPFPVND